MNLTDIGRYLGTAANAIPTIAYYFFGGVLLAVIVLLLLRIIVDALKLSPFGKFAYYATRPANQMIGSMRNSRYFYPLKRALSFDPAILMVFISTALICYVGFTLTNYLTMILGGIANALIKFGNANVLSGGKFLIGTVLIAVIFFLLSLMLIVFVNSLFGLLPKLAQKAEFRIRPLLQLFEFGGIFAGWSFLILWIALSFAATAVQLIFLSEL